MLARPTTTSQRDMTSCHAPCACCLGTCWQGCSAGVWVTLGHGVVPCRTTDSNRALFAADFMALFIDLIGKAIHEVKHP